MFTEGPAEAGVAQVPDSFADAWAAVFIDVFERLKERGELPDDGETATPEPGGQAQ